MTNIMKMKSGTKLRQKRTGLIFTLEGHFNELTRVLKCDQYIGQTEYINANTQDDYEVVE